ncbi:MAG: NHL repeat-containing protein [Chloroflexi bacterium]|nr:NHL repeat-containing protein [Chloroflexota bacterium]
MAQNTVAAGRAWLYSHNIGRNGAAGMGFSQPVSIAAANDGVLYVTNRATEQNPGGIRVTKFTVEQEYLGEFGRQGLAYGSDEPTTFTWISGVALDKVGNVYVADEWQCRVAVFDADGNPLTGWGVKGEGEGELSGPAGMAFDADDNVWVVNSFNSRIQKFTKDGQFISGFGSKGEAEGQFEMPDGIEIDGNGDLYIADWGNNRVQKFTPGGTHLRTFAHQVNGRDALNHPTDVCVDGDGDVYITDWMNDRVVIYDPDAKPIAYLEGDAVEVSKWGQMGLDANPDMVKARRRVPDLIEQQRRFVKPAACTYDRDNNLLFVVDTARNRVQVYEKDHEYMDPQINL